MKKFHIGIDFGTYQSKACVYNFRTSDHEFFKFNGSDYFIPSRIVKKADGTFRYGNDESEGTIEEYRYFKMESAEDEEFHTVTFEGNTKSDEYFYKFNNKNNYTAEFLSVIYLTYVQFKIKEHYKKYESADLPQKSGLLGRLFSRKTSETQEVSYTARIGIPTEWSQKNNLKRKRKFENILIISEKLQKKYAASERFLSSSADQLIKDVAEIYTSYKTLNKDEFEMTLNDLGISVYPETAAGLAFIINSKQIMPGYYSAMDIGAGTTDISFFQVIGNRYTGFKIKYLASESYMIASNDVYREYLENVNSIHDLKNAQEEVRLLIDQDIINKKLKKSLITILNKLDKRLYKLFNKRVFYFNNNMINNYKNQPIILYGGGAHLPYINSGQVIIHDNGVRDSLTMEHTSIEKIDIDNYASNINILPEDNTWKPVFSMLVVALGLSYVKHESDAEWFDDADYKNIDGDGNGGTPNLMPHPFNEGFYIYDVLNSSWSTDKKNHFET